MQSMVPVQTQTITQLFITSSSCIEHAGLLSGLRQPDTGFSLCQNHPVHALPSYYVNSNCNTYLRLGFSSDPFYLYFPTKTFYAYVFMSVLVIAA
jgi:hypothetical protein